MRITIEADGKTVDAEVTPGDIIRFEDEFGVSLASLQVKAGKDIPAGHLRKTLFLAWCVAKRTKKTELPFIDWCDTVAVGADVKVEDSVPLDQPPSDSPSS